MPIKTYECHETFPNHNIIMYELPTFNLVQKCAICYFTYKVAPSFQREVSKKSSYYKSIILKVVP